MFQTDLNLWLQSFASDGLTAFMKGITASGYEPFYVGLLVIVMIGVDFRRGFLLFQLIVWTGMVTELLKHLYALPRPSWVDPRVLNLEAGRPEGHAPVEMGPLGFFQLPPPEIVNTFRSSPASYGFPSGHVGGACAVWGGLALLFRKHLFYWLAPVMIILMGVSRMYLGRHFLADVLGGVLVGGAVLALAAVVLERAGWHDRLFEAKNFMFSLRLPNVVLFFVLLLVPVLLLGLSFIKSNQAGYVVGLDAAFLVLVRRGLPRDSGRFLQRAARVVLVAVLFVAAALLIRAGGVWLVSDDGNVVLMFFQAAIPSFFAFWAGVLWCLKLGLYGDQKTVSDT